MYKIVKGRSKKDGAAIQVSEAEYEQLVQALSGQAKDQINGVSDSQEAAAIGSQVEFQGRACTITGFGNRFKADGYLQRYVYVEVPTTVEPISHRDTIRSEQKPTVEPAAGHEWYSVVVQTRESDVREFATEWRQRPTKETAEAKAVARREAEDKWFEEHAEPIEARPDTSKDNDYWTVDKVYEFQGIHRLEGPGGKFYSVTRDGVHKWFKAKGN